MLTKIGLQSKFLIGLSFFFIIHLTSCADDYSTEGGETIIDLNTSSANISNRSSAERIVFGNYTIDGCCVQIEVFTDYDISPENAPIHQIDIFNNNGDLVGSVFHGDGFDNNWIPNPDPDSPYGWGWILEWCGCDGTYCFIPNIIGQASNQNNQQSQSGGAEICIDITECTTGPCESAGLNYDSENCILSWEECPGWNATLTGPNGQIITDNPFSVPEEESGIYSLTYTFNRECDPIVYQHNVECNECEPQISQDFFTMQGITSNCRYLVRAKWNVDNCDCCEFGYVDHYVHLEVFNGAGESVGTHDYTQSSGSCDISGMSAAGYWNLNSSSFLEVCDFGIGETITCVVHMTLLDDGNECGVNHYQDSMTMEYTVESQDHQDCDC